MAQEELLEKAWEDAGVNPEDITYIEAHGTGTPLGDNIELKGIMNAFKKYSDKKQFCAIGSIKTNIGHLSESAGIAGVVKAVMALKNKELLPQINFMRPNEKIDFLIHLFMSIQDYVNGRQIIRGYVGLVVLV